ncbi:hypothetical protein ACM39_16525 [Chryseobacterium sp. FH2]|uniref:hypothetical protein n=1 Tax=Chryseobacterium sp. FH2 TaxID=1674291 RepID=UPI00065ABC8D|nr:hypothetical protein [Chryseobacterium sp. FH2]KMQ65287.1 hypothetical protein ACM39_16525 [Chryseobacterium sp. FH2]
MKTIKDFKKDNEKMCLDLKKASATTGAGPKRIETYTTNLADYGGSDSETWVYDGGTPISGTITDSQGNNHTVL